MDKHPTIVAVDFDGTLCANAWPDIGAPKAMNIEIEKQLAEHTRRHAIEIESMVLLVLHEQFGFGLTRLMRFSENFEPHLENLIAKYEMDDTDKAWLCTHKLKEYGIDVEKIYAEKGLV